MKVQISPLDPFVALKERLERDGWRVDQGQDGSLLASHSAVKNEPHARWRLHLMGLLTSRNVRIEFHAPPGAGGRYAESYVPEPAVH
ncbi:MAG: hypothetical protein HYS13_23460 [Planctomycetia bacterium]|nr:hypothetical protein [Planctomycetia bacterium]